MTRSAARFRAAFALVALAMAGCTGGRQPSGGAAAAPVVLDGAHVPSSLAAVLDELEADPPGPGRPLVVLGTGPDKDAAGLLKLLAGRVDRVLCTPTGDGPHRDPRELSELAEKEGLEAEKLSTPWEALERAASIASPGAWILVTGSLHLVGEVRPLLRMNAVSEAPAGDPSC